jgi:hypothetical protein
MGVYLLQEELWIIFTNYLCAKLPRTRIRLTSPELALEFAPPIHSDFKGAGSTDQMGAYA